MNRETPKTGRLAGSRRKPRTRRRFRLIQTALLLLLLFFLFVIVGAVRPFTKQPQISNVTKENFHPEDYYGKGNGPDRARIIEDNKEALDTRLQMIRHAKERIILSTFDFRTDEAGKDMLALLLNAADRGVSVEIFADGFNSWLRMEGNSYFYALSSHPNVQILLYNKMNLLKPQTIMGRMHDKYLIIDDTAYLLGGRNTFGYFLGDYEGHKNYDWDVLVYNTGSQDSSLYQVLSYYETITAMPECSIFHDSEKLSRRSSVQRASRELRERFAALESATPALFEKEYDYAAQTAQTHKISLLHNPVHTSAKEPVVFYQLMELAKSAEDRVTIHTPYAVCNDMMYESFAELGEKAELMQNSAANNGNPFTAVDYLRQKQRLLDTGMTIMEYEGGVSYHGKAIAIDDDLSVIGSFNMDMRSAYIDTELMLVIHGEAVTADLRQKMDQYEASSAVAETMNTYHLGPLLTEMKEVSLQKKLINTCLGWLLDRVRFLF